VTSLQRGGYCEGHERRSTFLLALERNWFQYRGCGEYLRAEQEDSKVVTGGTRLSWEVQFRVAKTNVLKNVQGTGKQMMENKKGGGRA